MIKVKQLYIQDMAKAPFVDRFFYYLLNHFKPDFSGRDYMTLNPLKWSLLTLIMSVWVVFVFLVLMPIIGIPSIIYDAYKMPDTYKDKEHHGWYVSDVTLIRSLPTQ